MRALAGLAHGHGHEGWRQVAEHFARSAGLCRPTGRAQRQLLAAAAGRDQPDADFDQTEIAFQRQHALGGVHGELATTTERHALHGSHDRQLRILDGHRRLLELAHRLFEAIEITGHAGIADLLEIGADGKGRVVPDDQAIETAGCLLECSQYAVEDFVADGVHLGLEGNDADPGVDRRQRPQTDTVVFEQGLAAALRLGQGFTQQ